MYDHTGNKRSAIISLYESKHNENDRVKSHHHRTHQILYTLEGKGKCTLDEHPYQIARDSFIIIPPLTEHSIAAESKMTVLVLEFDATVLGDDIQQQLVESVFQKAWVQKLNMFDSSELRQLLRKMLYEQSHGDRLWKMGLKLYMAELLFTIARSPQDTPQTDMNTLRVEQLRHYIDTRYFDIKNAEDIANRMGMSKRYMQSIFNDYYDSTPMQYLTEVRLGLVKQLLVETEKDIVSICFEVGFESLSTFYRLFKRHIGVPPNMYRTTQRGK
ncbi:AraC family transcriptional regulator [Halobacillus naozhouensis]|uniref:AraC family transcriptional regulator n=1 Tax=Halobacillus naozhouensis TaxID=554880 RepID=A0ABY8IXF5_9BACI|nr:AraC family transcriptional regulator [Halobacillus naozhouensis]WFT74022.1 AraC family transcriptional regulator [Halobacillus naozhouensis]